MDDRSYESPFGSRYGSHTMASLWSEAMKHQLWREGWLKLYQQQVEDGLLPRPNPQQMKSLQLALSSECTKVELAACEVIEQQLHHDLVAALEWTKHRLALAGFEHPEHLHLGATSSDIEDYADARRVEMSCELLRRHMTKLAKALYIACKQYLSVPTIGKTHLQPAEPTTVGYRFAVYLQQYSELFRAFNLVHVGYRHLAGSLSMGGAVGTHGTLSYIMTVHGVDQRELLHYQDRTLRFQVHPRTNELQLANSLSAMAAWLHKVALDMRLMQADGLLKELKTKEQVGSSAMPGKANPITSEKVCSLARHVRSLAVEVWDYTANSMLERTLDDSAARRYCLPELFLTMDELLSALEQVFYGAVVIQSVGLASVHKASSTWMPARIFGLARSNGRDVTQKQVLADLFDENGRLLEDGLQKYSVESVSWSIDNAIQRAELAAEEALSYFDQEEE